MNAWLTLILYWRENHVLKFFENFTLIASEVTTGMSGNSTFQARILIGEETGISISRWSWQTFCKGSDKATRSLLQLLNSAIVA